MANTLVEQHGQDAPIPASTVGVQRYLCPVWVKTGLLGPTAATSALGGEADEIRTKPDIDT